MPVTGQLVIAFIVGFSLGMLVMRRLFIAEIRRAVTREGKPA